MINLISRSVLLLGIFISTAFAEQFSQTSKIQILGKILDSDTKIGLEYANVVLYKESDNSQVTGTITDVDGNFRLIVPSRGKFFVKADFIGYEVQEIRNIDLTSDKRRVSLGDIYLKYASIQSEEVEVVAERSPVTAHIDKKVVNVSSQITSVSGNATDVLENVPSVAVDVEGNVSLRGSENFRVLIDGVPSVLDPSDALQQIPASTIDKIEIITNPSVKYAPDGDSGIINIITKKGKLEGASGVVNLNTGINDKHGADFLLNYRKGNYQFFLGGDFNKNERKGSEVTINRTTENGITSYINSDGSSTRNRDSWGINTGVSGKITPNDDLNFSVRFGDRSFGRSSLLNYEEYSDLDENRLYYKSDNDFERSGGFYSLSTNYKHSFNQKGHEISTQVVYSNRKADEESVNELTNTNNQVVEGQISKEFDDPSKRLEARLDYTLPFTEKDKFEFGIQNRIRLQEEMTERLSYDTLQAIYVLEDGSVRHTEYDEDIRSVYGIYARKGEKFGFQAGVRGEYTGREISVTEDNSEFSIDRWDFFPTFHTSYEFSKGNSVMASYSRRIKRPRGWYLEPFETWTDAYNVRRGNPDLKPEDIDSYEIGYQTILGNATLSSEVYYRASTNKIERVRSVYAENVTLHSFENVGEDYSLGAEFMLNTGFFSWWDLNYSANLYKYKVEGELNGVSFDESSFSWGFQLNNTLKLNSDTKFQLSSTYRSSTASAQGERKGFLTFNAAVRYNVIRKFLTATLQVRDIFGSSKRESITEGVGFYEYNSHKRDAPTVMVNLNFNFNNYKPERNKNRSGGDDDGGEF